jgi:hypothetical protein
VWKNENIQGKTRQDWIEEQKWTNDRFDANDIVFG